MEGSSSIRQSFKGWGSSFEDDLDLGYVLETLCRGVGGLGNIFDNSLKSLKAGVEV